MLVSANRQNVPLSSVDVKREREALSFPQTVDKVPDESPGFSYVLVIPNSFLEN